MLESMQQSMPGFMLVGGALCTAPKARITYGTTANKKRTLAGMQGPNKKMGSWWDARGLYVRYHA